MAFWLRLSSASLGGPPRIGSGVAPRPRVERPSPLRFPCWLWCHSQRLLKVPFWWRKATCCPDCFSREAPGLGHSTHTGATQTPPSGSLRAAASLCHRHSSCASKLPGQQVSSQLVCGSRRLPGTGHVLNVYVLQLVQNGATAMRKASVLTTHPAQPQFGSAVSLARHFMVTGACGFRARRGLEAQILRR